MGSTILLVEDEAALAEGIAENLNAEGHQVVVCGDGQAALERWQQGGFDLVVLDVMLPHVDGYGVCQKIREAGDKVPILFLTAKNDPSDRIHGLQLGGDDYLGKPFHLAELLARVEAMLRRQDWGGMPSDAACDCLFLGNHWVDFRTFEVGVRSDAPQENTHADTGQTEHSDFLPQKEAMILKYLAERPGDIVSREDILDAVWGEDVFPSTRTIDNFIVRLRRRFEDDPAHPRRILTVRGVGYRFVQG